MRRREFLGVLGAAVALPLAVRAQQPERMRRIGVMSVFGENDADAQSSVRGLVQRLDELGWTAGRNLDIDYLTIKWDVLAGVHRQQLRWHSGGDSHIYVHVSWVRA